MVWTGDALFWLAIISSLFGIMLLPIAYIMFYLMMNKDSMLGKDRPRGFAAVRWNVGMGIAALAATGASLYVIYTKFGQLLGKITGYFS